MNVSKHKLSFEEIYKELGDRLGYSINFPLVEIEKFDWRRGEWSDGFYNYFYRRFTSHILSRLELSDNQKVLVIGCGAGFDEKNIKSIYNNIKLSSIDISQNMLVRAINSKSPSHFSLAIAERLPFPNNCFDRIVSREVIEHVMDPQMMLKEIHRVLKPGGIAVITTENEESLGPTNYYDSRIMPKIASFFNRRIPALPFKDEAPTIDKMKSFVNTAGLKIEEIFYDGALYKFLPEIKHLFESNMPKIAHYFSCLENNKKIAFAFCDQVKYVIKKADAKSTAEAFINEICHVCIDCKTSLIVTDERYECPGCGRIYPLLDGIPAFLPDDSFTGAKNISSDAPMNSSNQSLLQKLSDFAFPRVNILLRRVYIIFYLVIAILCTFFVKRNKKFLSRILDKNDPYQKYLKIY